MESAKHSRIGIASFATGAASAALILVSTLVVALRSPPAHSSGGAEHIDLTIPVILSLCLLGAMIALRLGIGGLTQQARSKRFAISGIVLSAATIMAASLLMGFGGGMR